MRGKETVVEDNFQTSQDMQSEPESPQTTPQTVAVEAHASAPPRSGSKSRSASPVELTEGTDGEREMWAFGVRELAQLYRVKQATVKRYIKTGELDPTDFKSVCLLWYQSLKRRAKCVVVPEVIHYPGGFGPHEPVGPVRVYVAAKVLGVEPSRVYALIKAGVVTSYKVAGSPNADAGHKMWAGRNGGVHGVIISEVRAALGKVAPTRPAS